MHLTLEKNIVNFFLIAYTAFNKPEDYQMIGLCIGTSIGCVVMYMSTFTGIVIGGLCLLYVIDDLMSDRYQIP